MWHLFGVLIHFWRGSDTSVEMQTWCRMLEISSSNHPWWKFGSYLSGWIGWLLSAPPLNWTHITYYRVFLRPIRCAPYAAMISTSLCTNLRSPKIPPTSRSLNKLHPVWLNTQPSSCSRLIIQDKNTVSFQAPLYYVSEGLFLLYLWISYRSLIWKCVKPVLLYARIGLNVAQAIELKVKQPLKQGYITQF